jgi:hypothetical protein
VRVGTLQPSIPTSFNEPHDVNDRYLTTSFQQREQRARALGRLQSAFSPRPSSSSGSASQSLRRTPGIEDLHRPQSRSASVGSPDRLRTTGRPQVRFVDPESTPSHQRSASVSAVEGHTATHPALRISRRTAAAILVALESTRTPQSFTPDLAEEKAQMADLGRASNGGARGGPVPVGASRRPGVVPPTEIMRRREERERAAQAAAEEQRRQQMAQATSAIQPTDPQSQSSSRRHSRRQSEADAANRRSSGRPVSDQRQDDPRGSMSQQTTLTNAPPGPSQAERTSYEQPPPRTRANTQGSAQPRPAPPQAQPGPSGTQRVLNPQQDPQFEPESDSPSQIDDRQYEQQTPQTQRTAPAPAATRPGFPHAFQRWEDLSAKWEGLTGYWLRRIEQTAEETRDQPLNAQLSRQITDLSAAGGNLFHALVELQRLRASSERKFQRWFFETRKNEERTQEISAQLERALVAERQARADDIASWEAKVEQAKRTESNASKLVGEMRRELEISKGESRRAWEELGRREEEERERVAALKEGQAIVVGGYTVHPKQFQQESVMGSMSQSQSQRPATRDGPTQAAAERQYQEDQNSPTNTDPFTEMRPSQSAAAPSTLAWQSEAAAVGAAAALAANQAHLQQTGRPSASSSGSIPPTYQPVGGSQPRVIGYQNDQPVYESRGSLYSQQNAHLHPSAPASMASPTATYATHTNTDEYGSELEEGFEMDEQGVVVRDASGRPIPYRRGLHRLASQSGDSEESDGEREATHSAAVAEYERQEAEMAPRQRENEARQALAREQQAWEQEQARHQQRMAQLQQAAQISSSTAVSYPSVPASTSSTSKARPFFGSPTPSPPPQQTSSMRVSNAPATAGGVPPRSFFGTPSPPPSSPPEMRTSAGSTGAFVSTAPPIPAPPADYSGQGYGARWDPVHHQPTRLSDVMEEGEEEARSRVSSRSLGLGRSSGAPF